MSHDEFMRRAIAISEEMMRAGMGGPFGAVIVRRGRIIAEGYNRVTSANDPTAHAEVVAIREACRALDSFSLEECEIYSNCEPCPMCLAAIYWARLDCLYYANSREDAARVGFDDDRIYHELARPLHARELRTVRLLADEARPAFEEWAAKPDKIEY